MEFIPQLKEEARSLLKGLAYEMVVCVKEEEKPTHLGQELEKQEDTNNNKPPLPSLSVHEETQAKKVKAVDDDDWLDDV